MKSFFKYIFFFLTVFSIAAGMAYYSIRIFTQSADEIILPELTGKNIIYVLETLTRMGLNAKLYGSQYDDIIPKYAVISQDPNPGTTIKKGRDVIIVISKGTKENIIPDLRQIPLERALILLEKNELKKGYISYTYSSKTQKGSIIAQYPNPFSTVVKQSLCDLLVSRGAFSPGLIMPDIKGLPLKKASEIINNYQLDVSKIQSDKDMTQDFGIVLSSTPEAGSFVTRQTPVTLVVNYPEKNKQMIPDKLNSVVLITHHLTPGFLNRHVRIETDMFGPIINLYNEYMKPGVTIKILVPLKMKTFFNIFIDHKLVRTIIIDPWKKDSDTGDTLLWESSPPQFYQPISPGWVKN